MTTGSTWQEDFLRSNTCSGIVEAEGIKMPAKRRAYRADAQGNAIPDQLMWQSTSATSASSEAGNDVVEAEGDRLLELLVGA